MVVTCLPATLERGATQERIAFPSKCTVQAPHRAMPQPNFVPVSRKESRITQSSGVEGSSSTETDFPFKKKEVTVHLAELVDSSTTLAQLEHPNAMSLIGRWMQYLGDSSHWRLRLGWNPLQEYGRERWKSQHE